jgi:two-component system, sensor histidine kinase and response regulator
MGYRVDVASDGIEALEALEGKNYAAVLMDVQMPNMGGYEATAEIRSREEGAASRTPVIAITANAMQGDREKALEAGMDDYVAKPIRAEELEAALKRWIPATETETIMEDAMEESKNGSGNIGPEAGEASARSEGATEEVPVDRSELEKLRKFQGPDDPDIVAELADLFFEDAPPLLRSIEEAVERGEAESLERAAHALKGNCGTIGARRMARMASDLQNLRRSGDTTQAADLVNEIEAEFERVRAWFEAELRGANGPGT